MLQENTGHQSITIKEANDLRSLLIRICNSTPCCTGSIQWVNLKEVGKGMDVWWYPTFAFMGLFGDSVSKKLAKGFTDFFTIINLAEDLEQESVPRIAIPVMFII